VAFSAGGDGGRRSPELQAQSAHVVWQPAIADYARDPDRAVRDATPRSHRHPPRLVRRGAAGAALNYFGQGALVLTDPNAIDSPFYKLAPHWALIPLGRIGGAGDHHRLPALVSGVFSLTRQAMQVGLCLR
jgi:K+ potassium transporter